MSNVLPLDADAAPTMFESFVVVGVPSALMLLGCSVAFFGRVPEKVQAATQNFSAGLLISAVAGELFPLMNGQEKPAGFAESNAEQPSDVSSTIAIGIGFLVALVFMFGLEALTEDDEEEDEERVFTSTLQRKMSELEAPLLSGAESTKALDAVSRDAQNMEDLLENLQAQLPKKNRDTLDEAVHALKVPVHAAKRHLANSPTTVDDHNILRMRRHSEELAQNIQDFKSCTDVPGASQALRAIQGTLKHLHKHAERVKFKVFQPAPMPNADHVLEEKFPWSLFFTVAVDAGVDGLLIGLAFSASVGAGWSMSIATSIEMFFLGLSFSATIQNTTRSKVKHAGMVALPPVILLASGVLAHFIGGILQETPLMFTGFISFAVVALLFLVTQELLAEAREVAGENKLLNSMFFVGVYGGILLEKFVG